MKKLRILIIILIILVIIAVVSFILTSPKIKKVNAPPSSKSGLNQNLANKPSSQRPKIPSRISPEQKEQGKIIQLATMFAPRFGSYSNQSDYENFKSLEKLMTPEMKEWTEKFIKEEKEKQKPGQVYWGVTSRVISARIDSFDLKNGKAEVSVVTQRQEKTGNQEKLYYQTLLLKMVKQGEEWKVSFAQWQKK